VTEDISAADQAARETWSRAADAWERHQAELREVTASVSQWMVDAIDPQPGQRVLELAAGPGETGFIAAARLGPGGTLVSSDQSEEMVSVARRRAQALGLQNVEFAVVDAQQLEFDSARFDAALCRFGYMLVGDPGAALRETRRVLKDGGRLALAVWDSPRENLWMAAPAMQLVAAGAMPMPEPGAPGPFSMADRTLLAGQLADAGFSEIETSKVALVQTYQSFDQYWELTRDLAAPIAVALETIGEHQGAQIREAVRDVLTQFATDGDALSIPASAVVASANV
jgi:ubiquinone/menaquinone biosynthesis C-methylase UbiE